MTFLTDNNLRQHGGNIKEVAHKFGPGQYLDFSANINPLGLAPQVEDAIRSGIGQVVHYPEPDARSLSQAVAEYLGVQCQQIACGNGASEFIYLLTRLLAPRRAVIPQPTFSEYQLAAAAAAAEIVSVPMLRSRDFRWDVTGLAATITSGDMVFLCNPNNPVGNLLERDGIIGLLNRCEQVGATLVVDESFRDFVVQMPTVIGDVGNYNRLIVLYSLTKFFAIPGLRLGCMVAPENIINRVNRTRDPWSVNSLAQFAGQVAVKQRDYINRSRKFVAKEKQWLYQRLRHISALTPFYPQANYIFIDISNTGLTSTCLRRNLIEHGIIVRDCVTYPTLGGGYIRVAVRQREENKRLLNALSAVLS